MESNGNDLNFKGNLVNELVEGRNLTRDLKLNLTNEPHSSSNEVYELMANKILAKFERSLQILQYDPMNQVQFQRITIETADSPNSFSGSPKRQDSDGGSKDLAEQKNEFKRRRISPRITQRVQGSPSSGLEAPMEDGYNWRKYGQKDILGAKYPRAYYRCTFRTFQGCCATKQVQRTDDDPSYFEVSYRGKHTCSQVASSSSSVPNPNNPNNPKPKPEPIDSLSYPPHHSQNIIWDFKSHNNNIQDIKPNITSNNINHLKSSSFSFPSSSNPLVDTQQNPTTMLTYSDNNFVDHANFPTHDSTRYTNHMSPSSLMMNNNFDNDHNNNNYMNFSIDDPPQGASMQEVIHPSSTSDNNSPTIASELSFDYQGEFDEAFTIENKHFFQ